MFTPDWIVRYLVENTLGNYYVRMNPNTDLTENWEYFIKNNSNSHDIKKLEDIKFIDPCMGSGHILVYAFDLLLSFYQENGYAARDAAELILRNNLYGLDIDERAYQLSYFSLMMKARQYNRKILTLGISPNIYCIKNVRIEQPLKDYLVTKYYVSDELINRFNLVNENANLYGSILDVSSLTSQDIKFLYENLNYILDIQYKNLEELLFQEDIKRDLLPALRICEVLKQQYDFVVTNPPYLSSSLMPKELKQFITNVYKDCKSDMFAVFIKKCIQFSESNGYVGMLTPYVWMFISSYESLRNYVLNNVNISGLIQLEYNAFEAACVPVATFILHNTSERYNGNYIKLSEFRGAENQGPKTIEAINNHECGYYYETSTDNFRKIPGNTIAYWARQKTIELFQNHSISKYGTTSKGIITGDNSRFLRLWYEVDEVEINFNTETYLECETSDYIWYPCNKGGEYRKWYGNNNYLINWKHNGELVMQKGQKKIRNCQDYLDKYKFIESITWTSLSSSDSSFRYSNHALSESAGMTLFIKESMLFYTLAFLNSKLATYLIDLLNPTLNITAGLIANLPIKIIDNTDIKNICQNNINVSKSDWDSFETSWDFKTHPLVELRLAGASAWGDNTPSARISSAYKAWSMACEERFNQLKANEEELNKIFIDIYGLQDELTPEVEDKDVTVRKADLVRDIKSFISYAVGCMFGRYSLDVEGLAYAGGEWDNSKYTTFIPDADDIIPICDEEYYVEDDIVNRFIEFVKVVYGSDTLEENLKFIADALGGKGNPKDVLRNYFLNDFFKDHCNTYQVTGSGKRPIYWLFDSGKKNGFKALVYIHRYIPDLIARMRTGYVHPQQARYRDRIKSLQDEIDITSSTSEKVKLSKQLKKINEQLLELNKYEEIVHHWADKMEPMDLDDGVKINYAKFQELLAKIK